MTRYDVANAMLNNGKLKASVFGQLDMHNFSDEFIQSAVERGWIGEEIAEELLNDREKAESSETSAKANNEKKYYAINEEAARRANDMNSFYDYREGSATAEYRRMVDEAVAIAERQKSCIDPMYHEKIDHLLDTYARKLAENLNNAHEIEARVPSVLISGGGNFPVGKKNKQNAARDRNSEEFRQIQGLLDKIRSVGMGGISSDDPDAVKKLEVKLEAMERDQEKMKVVNAWYRKNKTLDGCPDLTKEEVEQLKAAMNSQWHYKDVPFLPYMLSNNNANIRRIRQRIEALKAQRAADPVADTEFDGGKIVRNKELNRLQILFDDIPDEDLRAELKGHGFRWSPKNKAWQRQLTRDAEWAAKRILNLK